MNTTWLGLHQQTSIYKQQVSFTAAICGGMCGVNWDWICTRRWSIKTFFSTTNVGAKTIIFENWASSACRLYRTHLVVFIPINRTHIFFVCTTRIYFFLWLFLFRCVSLLCQVGAWQRSKVFQSETALCLVILSVKTRLRIMQVAFSCVGRSRPPSPRRFLIFRACV